METPTAVKMINDMVYLPGWTLTASDHSARFQGTIRVRVDYPARNTNRELACQGYPESIDTYATFALIVEDCADMEDIYFKVVLALVEIWTHEIREALRAPGTFWAPYHPHRADGMKRWAAKTGQPLSGDLHFGIA